MFALRRARSSQRARSPRGWTTMAMRRPARSGTPGQTAARRPPRARVTSIRQGISDPDKILGQERAEHRAGVLVLGSAERRPVARSRPPRNTKTCTQPRRRAPPRPPRPRSPLSPLDMLALLNLAQFDDLIAENPRLSKFSAAAAASMRRARSSITCPLRPSRTDTGVPQLALVTLAVDQGRRRARCQRLI